MDMNLTEQRVLVTGGSKGIGFAIADVFAADGADVMAVGRDEARLAAAKAHGTAIIAHACDIGDAAARKGLIEIAGDIDILVNCAGAIPGGDLFALPIETWQESWQLKVFGYIDLTRLRWKA
ncbi:SDR family NAD(P)-dependent oxidoreductase [Jiella pacifica]|uniref:SDR family NAD(P)-dependent oxidoreductase n=1 Tax=Jiella pacifica TaxID=2696469 RepID=UPI0019403715